MLGVGFNVPKRAKEEKKEKGKERAGEQVFISFCLGGVATGSVGTRCLV